MNECATCGAPLELERRWQADASGAAGDTVAVAYIETVRCAAGHRYDVVAGYGPDRPA